MKYIKKNKPLDLLEDESLRKNVRNIINTIKEEGDSALLQYGKKWDDCQRENLKVSEEEIKKAYEEVDEELLESIKFSLKNIKEFSEVQKNSQKKVEDFEIRPGVFLGHSLVPVDSCMCYIPGGNYPLFSSALMLIVPAKVAGVERIVAMSPAKKGTEKIDSATLVAMDLAGADEIYVTGGAQAVAAAAFGTETIDPVNLIVGPGNQYVSEAKRQVYGQVGIDFIAGPSEVLVVADSTGNPKIIAADLLAQSEHDYQAKGILVSDCEELILKTQKEVEKQLKVLPEDNLAHSSWENNGALILVDSLEEAAEISNKIAPEHLEIMVKEDDFDKGLFRNYGGLFIGNYAAEVLGDYATGTNHTLPTSGAGRYTGGVFVGTFLKTLSYEYLTDEGFKQVKDATKKMATGEGLTAHRRAIEVREDLL